MTFLTNPLLKKMGRNPAVPPFPFQELLPMRLRDKVSGKGDKTSNVACLHEMMLMLACFKKNDFNQAICNKEINRFQKCFDDFRATEAVRKEQEEKGIIATGSSKLSAKQLNLLLKQFPQPK